MSVFTAADIPDYPPEPDPLDDAHPRLRPREFFTQLDAALDHGRNARPDTVHIAPKRRAAWAP